jgi:hypothetical protein
VTQEIDNVKGKVIGLVMDNQDATLSLESNTTQKVDTVESGASVIGTIVGKDTQVDGQRHYGDITNIGTIAESSNIAIGKGNKQSTSVTNASAGDIAAAFSTLMQAVQGIPESPEKSAAKTAVQNLEAEAEKGEDAEESKVQSWFTFLAKMAPDVYEVAINTFSNPILGLSTVFRKVAERARNA